MACPTYLEALTIPDPIPALLIGKYSTDDVKDIAINPSPKPIITLQQTMMLCEVLYWTRLSINNPPAVITKPILMSNLALIFWYILVANGIPTTIAKEVGIIRYAECKAE